MSIYCIGQAAYDITFPMGEKIVENQKYRILDKFECIGAPATNAAYLCALWEEDTTLIARMGDDFYGREITRVLKSVHVNTDYIFTSDKLATPLSCIIAHKGNGNRTILNYPGILENIMFPLPEAAPTVLHMDGHELDASLAALSKYPEAISLIDAGTVRESTLKLGALVDYLVCSEDFAFQYTGIKADIHDWSTCIASYQKLKELNSKNVVITLGSNGLLYEENGELKHLDAFKTTAIDTTGAGDIFHGAFAYCLAKKYSLLDILKISSMTASISTETLGGQSSIPTKETVNNRLQLANEITRITK